MTVAERWSGPGFDRARSRWAAAGLSEACRSFTLGAVSLRDLVKEGHS